MAGSLNHIVGDDGSFTPSMCESMRDCYMALAEFHQFVAVMATLPGGPAMITSILRTCAFPVPEAMPKVQPELHGAASDWRKAMEAAG